MYPHKLQFTLNFLSGRRRLCNSEQRENEQMQVYCFPNTNNDCKKIWWVLKALILTLLTTWGNPEDCSYQQDPHSFRLTTLRRGTRLQRTYNAPVPDNCKTRPVGKPRDRSASPSVLTSTNPLRSPRPLASVISRHPSQFSLRVCFFLCKLALRSETSSLERLSSWHLRTGFLLFSAESMHCPQFLVGSSAVDPDSWSSCAI